MNVIFHLLIKEVISSFLVMHVLYVYIILFQFVPISESCI